ncbi:XamI family restriction endonuclease, partial [Anaerolineae bacterium CFX9]|nr:XamI family restriction endonuclease [Anaerolineae bacterium CFX9]
MGVNLDKPQRWKADTQLSIDKYNRWFLQYAPAAYRETRIHATTYVEDILKHTDNLLNITVDILFQYPDALQMFRMSTAPPVARDRLAGLAHVSRELIERMEKHKRVPRRMSEAILREQLERIITIVKELLDQDIFIWLADRREPGLDEIHRASTVVADRICGMLTDPLIRNAQEKRQLEQITTWLEARGYARSEIRSINDMKPGTFAHHVNVRAMQS